ncbi:DNA primase [Pseudobacter ginsenosidimutans]|uniref:DNA primase n=1 Tax=Pseudobacter ginsenosidimutans TaxID=661488 RepID=A0A4V2F203_9BACT|nr:DNA primase [Pseudobacter ginsenosidimutans]RZS75576.1 DNA primase [Pseudobacter ginsenosidimutans]
MQVKVISQHTIQQILSRIDIVEIVGSYVKLKKRGINYLGLCPFHNEKTPSFTVSANKEIYKCFGCGKSGNAIGFLMDLEKYSYVEALRWLANKYGVEVEETAVSPEVVAQRQVADSLYIINQFGQKYFEEKLFNSDEGQDIALSYLKERGFREEVLRKFQVGYSLQDSQSFVTTALNAQYNIELLVKSGLVAQRDGRSYDNYRGRIIFPVHNQSGKIIGFGARVIGKAERAPKYINTPENELYHKSKILYGSYQARQSIDKLDECLLVEGYTDVISLHQAGIENVVASGGTSLTPDQLRLIHKYTNNLTIIYDGDGAGVKAALRGLELALMEGLNVQLVLIPDNEDPDSYVNKVGAAAFQEFVKANKKEFIIFQLEVMLKDAGNDTNKKAAVVNQMAETISKLNKAEDFTKQQDYIRRCSELLRVEEDGFNNLVNKFIRDKVTKENQQQQKQQAQQQQGNRSTGNKGAAGQPHNFNAAPTGEDGFFPEDTFYAEDGDWDQGSFPDGGGAPASTGQFPGDDTLALLTKDEQSEKAVIQVLLEHGSKAWEEASTVASYMIAEVLENQLLDNPEYMRILEMYKTWYEAGLEPGVKNFLYHEDQQLSQLIVKIMDFPYELSGKWTEVLDQQSFKEQEATHLNAVNSCIHYLKLRKIRRIMEENQRDMAKEHTPEEQLVLLQTHVHLKQMEIELVKKLGTVIMK